MRAAPRGVRRPSCSTPSLQLRVRQVQPVGPDRHLQLAARAARRARSRVGCGSPSATRPGSRPAGPPSRAAPLRACPDGRRSSGSRHPVGNRTVGERVHRDDGLDQRTAAGHVQCGAHRRGDRDTVDHATVRRTARLPRQHQQPRRGPAPSRERSPRRRRVTRTARRPEHLGRGVAAEHALARRRAPAAARDRSARFSSTSASHVHIGEQPPKARPHQHGAGQQARRDRDGPTERNPKVHAEMDGADAARFPSPLKIAASRTPYAGLNRRRVPLSTISGSGSPAPRRGSPSRRFDLPPWRACSRPAARLRGCCCSARRSAAAGGRGRRRRGR